MCDYYITLTIRPSIPNWANWLAQDKYGMWWVYECEPQCGVTSWLHNGGRAQEICRDVNNPGWQNTLYKIEREK